MARKRRNKKSISHPSLMDYLPPSLILEILSRLADSSDLTRCRLTCKTLNTLSYEVTSFNFSCSFDRYVRSRAYLTSTPFKSVVTRFITQLLHLDSVSLGVDYSLTGVSFNDMEDEVNDLHLTDTGFVSDWLMSVKDRLKKLSINDFWVQAAWRKSEVLSLISEHCHRLSVLEVKNAWLSVERVNVMPSLTNLTLEYVRLDDINLSKLNDCFPCLQTLTLVGNGELSQPKICLQNLRSCQWVVSNAPSSLTIVAPKMVELKLDCVSPKSILLRAPLLSDFHLKIDKTLSFDIGELSHLQKLRLVSPNLNDYIQSFLCSKAVKELNLESLKRAKLINATGSNLGSLFDVFTNVRSLHLGPGAYSEMEASFTVGKLGDQISLKCLKDFEAELEFSDVEVTISFISFLLDKCDNLSTVSLLIHPEVDSAKASDLISRCEDLHPQVRWKLGSWTEHSLSIRCYTPYPSL